MIIGHAVSETAIHLKVIEVRDDHQQDEVDFKAKLEATGLMMGQDYSTFVNRCLYSKKASKISLLGVAFDDSNANFSPAALFSYSRRRVVCGLHFSLETIASEFTLHL